MAVGFVFGLILTTMAAYLRQSFLYWSQRNVQTLPLTIFLKGLGNILLQRQTQGQLIQSTYKYFKSLNLSYGGFYLLTKPVLVITDANLANRMLTTDFDNFTDHGVGTNPDFDPLNGGVFFLNGNKWKKTRNKLNTLFRSDAIKKMVDEMMMQNLQLDTGLVDIKAAIEQLMLKFNCSSLFKLRYNDDFRKYGKSALQFSALQRIKLMLCTIYPRIAKWLKLIITKCKVTKFFTETARKTITSKYKNLELNDLQLTVQLYSFFMAGFTTSAATLTIASVAYGATPYGALVKMKYTRKCIDGKYISL